MANLEPSNSWGRDDGSWYELSDTSRCQTSNDLSCYATYTHDFHSIQLSLVWSWVPCATYASSWSSLTTTWRLMSGHWLEPSAPFPLEIHLASSTCWLSQRALVMTPFSHTPRKPSWPSGSQWGCSRRRVCQCSSHDSGLWRHHLFCQQPVLFACSW
jgi:hypothetical protein